MTARVDRRLLWHPRQENKFIVGGGSTITLYEWDPHIPQFRHVTSQNDLQLMKCFAWSPHSTFDDLVAIGLSTGKVDLVRLEASKVARNNVVSSGPVLSLPVRSSRSCNALTFCSANPNLLAVGLDKVRGDPSLIVWDLEVASTTLPVSSAGGVSETFPKRAQSQVSRPNSDERTDHGVLHHYAITDVVSSVAFLPHSTNLLMAGVSYRWLRLFDLRHPGTNAPQAVASKVHGIATDPFDQHRVACFGDGVVTVWDARKLINPLLTFTGKEASADGARHHANDAFSMVEFSHVRRGLLATMERDSDHVRFWDIQQAHVAAPTRQSEQPPSFASSNDHSPPSKLSRLSWAAPSTILPWTTTAEPLTVTSEPPNVNNVILTDTRRTKSFPRALLSFALVPNSQAHPLTSNVVVVNKEGDLEMYAMHDAPKHAVWSARGDLTIGAGTTYKVISGFSDPEQPPEPWDIAIAPSIHGSIRGEEKSLDRRGRAKTSKTQTHLNSSERPGFGRGDKDGFPALASSGRESSLTATRHIKSRTYSPASIRRYPLDHSKSNLASHAPTSDAVRSGASSGQAAFKGLKEKQMSRSLSRSRRQVMERGVSGVVEGDISMIMRERVIQGYSSANALHNSKVCMDVPSDDLTLAEVWICFNHTREILSRGTSKVHGFDFAYQGLLGIWEGLDAAPQQDNSSSADGKDQLGASDATSLVSVDLALNPDGAPSTRTKHNSRRSHSPADMFHGNYHAALNSLNSRRDLDRSVWKPTVSTTKLAHRRLALALCDWKVGEEEFKRWEKEGKVSQVACWLVFTNQPSRAIDVLMRSKDESHQMMSGTLAALAVQHGSGSNSRGHELRNHCERLIFKLQDPHFRVMLMYMVFGDWSDIVDEEALPLRERLSIAFRFLDDKTLTSYLRRIAEECRVKGHIDGLAVTGLTPRGLDVLQSYIDTTGDMQTAAILSCFVCPGRFQDARAARWLHAYRDLLDGWKLFHYRCQFDIDQGKILHDAIQVGDTAPMEWVARQFLIRCTYCKKVVNSQRALEATPSQRIRAAACPHCGRALPRCSICLMSISIVPDPGRESDLLHSSYRDTIDDAFVFCQICRHGGHASHIIEWFYGEDGDRPRRSCPVADCDCYCDKEF